MASQETDQAAITKVLENVGCDEEFIFRFLNLVEKHRIGDGIALLEKKRRLFCNAHHVEQKKIDCLDYLIYKIEKENC